MEKKRNELQHKLTVYNLVRLKYYSLMTQSSDQSDEKLIKWNGEPVCDMADTFSTLYKSVRSMLLNSWI